MAPYEEIKQAPWYKPVIEKGEEIITREQRIKYAIQGWFNNEYLKNKLGIDYSDISKDLRNSINNLSKYTHINSETFNINDEEVEKSAYKILQNTLRFFMEYNECQIRINKATIECINEKMITEFYYNTISEIDALSSHHLINEYDSLVIKENSRDSENIYIDVTGSVSVHLMYGSALDRRNDDGYETDMVFPFTSHVTVSYKNVKGDVHITDSSMDVDVDSFYGSCE